MSNISHSIGGITPNNMKPKLSATPSFSSLDAIRDIYANDASGDNDSGDISYSTTKSNNGSGTKLDLFVNQEPAVIERLKKSIRVFVSQEVHGYMQQYREKIQYLKDTFRTQTQLYEEKINILEEENSTLLQTNSTLKSEVVMWQRKLQEQTDAYSKERQWLLEQLAAYAYTLQYVQTQAQPTSTPPDMPPSITVQPPIERATTENAASTSSATSQRRLSYALSTSTSTSDLPGLFPSPRSTSSPASHSVGVPPPPPAKLPPPPPMPSKDLFAKKPLKIGNKTLNSSSQSTPKAGAAFGNDLIDQIRKVRVDSGSRAAAFAKFEENRKTTQDSGKIATQQLTLQQLKKTGGVTKVEEHRKKQEEIIRQKVFTPGKVHPTVHNASTSTKSSRSTTTSTSDDDEDLETPISMMVNTFMKQSEDSDEEDDGKGLGDMLRSFLVSGRSTPSKAPP